VRHFPPRASLVCLLPLSSHRLLPPSPGSRPPPIHCSTGRLASPRSLVTRTRAAKKGQIFARKTEERSGPNHLRYGNVDGKEERAGQRIAWGLVDGV
jgi:hypothetical protein